MADFTGTTGDDVITGTDEADFIDVSQGGNDTVHAQGGDDVIFMGATLATGDHIDGGDGHDVLQLDGDYSHVVKLNKLISAIEEIDLAAGHDYHLLVGNANVAGAAMTLDASALASGDSATLDAHSVKSGAITLIGGQGNDTLIGSVRGDALNTLDGGGGNDIIYSDGTDFGNTKTIGGPHTIDGGSGNDTIYCANGDSVNGGDGNDVIRFDLYFLGHGNTFASVDGGNGDDRIFLFSATVTPGELQGGAGVDTLSVYIGLHLDMPEFSAASSGFEVLALSRAAVIDGDDASNNFDFSGFTITNNVGAIVTGAGGDDIIIGSTAGDWILGDDGNDALSGGAGKDKLQGDAGADSLDGGLGRDILIGGAGADVFVYQALQDSEPGHHSYDTITDFHGSDSDLIDLSAIDADTTQEGNQAFHLGGSSFTDTAGELIQFVDSKGHTILLGDVNGDGVADFELQFNHSPVLIDGNFIL